MAKKGDVIFFLATDGDNHLLQETVAFFSHSKNKVFHCAIVIEDNETIEANYGKLVGYAQASDYNCKHVVKTCPKLTDEQREGIIDYCKEQIGDKYDLVEIGDLLLRFFHIELPYHEPEDRVICSTLVRQAYASVGVILSPHENCSPEDLYESPELQ